MAELLVELDKLHLAWNLLTHLEERFRMMLDEPRLAAVKQKHANAFFQKGDLEEAVRLYEQVAQLGEKANAPHISQAANIQQAAALRALGQVDQARGCCSARRRFAANLVTSTICRLCWPPWPSWIWSRATWRLPGAPGGAGTDLYPFGRLGWPSSSLGKPGSHLPPG